MYSVAFLAALLAVCGAVSYGPPPAAPCCVAKRWQATMTDLKSKDNYKYAYTFAEDSVLQRDGSRVYDRSTGAVVMFSVNDYKGGATYTVDYTGKCTKTSQPRPFYGSCDSPMYTEAKYVGNGTLGGVDAAFPGIFYDAWFMKFPDGMNVTIALSRQSCVPLMQQIYLTTPVPGDMLVMINDVSTNVDASLLTIPQPCGDGSVVG